MPGQPMTWDDVYNATAITYPAVYRMNMTARPSRQILEDVADNLFNPDPYYQQGGDMVRVGGMGYRSTSMRAWASASAACSCWSGAPIEAEKEYVVAGWGSVNEGTQGPAIWEVVAAHLRAAQSPPQPRRTVRIVRAGN